MLSSCENGIGVQVPSAQAGNGYLFVTMSLSDPSVEKTVAAMCARIVSLGDPGLLYRIPLYPVAFSFWEKPAWGYDWFSGYDL